MEDLKKMRVNMQKSANTIYKDYRRNGGTLSFKKWVNREKAKGFLSFDNSQSIPVNKPLNDSIQKTLNQLNVTAGYKTDLENKYIFGVHRNVWWGIGIGTAVIITAVIIYKQKK